MSFDLNFPQSTGEPFNLPINMGDKVFIMGANGTGKSSLMQRLYTSYSANTRWISGHRQTWFPSNAMDLSPYQKQEYENGMRAGDTDVSARWKDNYASQRPSISIYDLINTENVRSRAIARAFDSHDLEGAKTISKEDGPIKIINELLRLSNIRIEISVGENDQIVASKCGSNSYGMAELSDGERNALLMAANVLTVKSGTLVLIDEPERHLHRSIISPLLTHLFSKREDCAFIVSTHDVMLPLDNPSARTLLIRGCTYTGSSLSGWDVNILPPGTEIDDDIKKDILGARRKILFVEGVENSLDKPLYSLVFPDVSIIAKSNCRDVERSVCGIRDSDNFLWVKAFGIVDNDMRPDADLTQLRRKHIYALPVYSVEAIYYHPDIQQLIAQRQAESIGGDASAYFNSAKTAAMQQIKENISALSLKSAEKAIRKIFFSHTPKKENIERRIDLEVSINVSEVVEQELERLENALDNDNYIELISRYPLHQTTVLDKIARELQFKNHIDYQRDVQKLLVDNPEALNFVKSLLGSVVSDINASVVSNINAE